MSCQVSGHTHHPHSNPVSYTLDFLQFYRSMTFASQLYLAGNTGKEAKAPLGLALEAGSQGYVTMEFSIDSTVADHAYADHAFKRQS